MTSTTSSPTSSPTPYLSRPPLRRVGLIVLVGLLIALAGCATDVDDEANVTDPSAEQMHDDGVAEDDDDSAAETNTTADQVDRPPPEEEGSDGGGSDGDGSDETDEQADEDTGDGDGDGDSADDSTDADEGGDEGDDETAQDSNGDDSDEHTGEDDSPSADPGEGEKLELHHLDVGQADSTVIITPAGETIIIDTGDWPDDGEPVISYLDSLGIDRIDHLVSTHAHADHIGGHAAVIEHFETAGDGIGAIYDSGVPHTTQTYDDYLDAAAEHDVDLFEVVAGDELPLADEAVSGTVLNPPSDPASDDMHDNSVSLLIEYGEISYLTTGDAESAAEGRMVDEWGSDLDADIYQAGHHGSSTSSTQSFMDAVSPQYAVISSAFDSLYGHPHDEVLERFDEFGIETYWTGAHGTVVLSTDGTTVSVETSLENSTAPLDLLALKHGEPAPDDPEDEDPEEEEPEEDDPADDPPEDDDGVAGAIEVAELNVDAPPEEEYIVLENTGDEALDLGSWEVRDREDDGQVAGGLAPFEFPADFELSAGQSVTIWTTEGENTQEDLYWGYGVNMWRADGDVVILVDPNGEFVFEHPYGDQV